MLKVKEIAASRGSAVRGLINIKSNEVGTRHHNPALRG